METKNWMLAIASLAICLGVVTYTFARPAFGQRRGRGVEVRRTEGGKDAQPAEGQKGMRPRRGERRGNPLLDGRGFDGQGFLKAEYARLGLNEKQDKQLDEILKNLQKEIAKLKEVADKKIQKTVLTKEQTAKLLQVREDRQKRAKTARERFEEIRKNWEKRGDVVEKKEEGETPQKRRGRRQT